MAASLEKQYQTQVELIAGHGGVFDVTVNGNLIFSKHKEYSFPDAAELIKRIDAQK